MRILSIIVLLVCVWQSGVRGQEDGEPRAAPSRGLLKRGLLAKGKQTTTTTTTPAPQEAEYEDEAEYADEAQEPSTEAPAQVSTEGKKLVAGGVRPFRSNADLLETLKRRRAQVAEAKLQGHSTATTKPSTEVSTEAPVKSSYSKKRVNNVAKESNSDEAPAPVKPGRGRFGRPAASSRSVQEVEPEEQNESAAAPTPARTGRTFYRRGGN